MRSGGPPDDGLGSELRSALQGRDDATERLVDERVLLGAVHRNAARRRRRHQQAATTLVLAGLTVTGALMTGQLPPSLPAPAAVDSAAHPASLAPQKSPPSTTPATGSAEATAPTRALASAANSTSTSTSAEANASAHASAPAHVTEPGQPVRPSDVAVESLTAGHQEQLWVLGTGRCHQVSCQVIAHTTDAGTSFSFRTGLEPAPCCTDAAEPAPGTSAAPWSPTPLPQPATRPVDDATGDLRYAVNGTDAWAYSGDVWATHDAGASWLPIEMPVTADVTSLQVWAPTVWAFGTARSNGAPVVFSAPVSEDTWSSHELGLTATDSVAAPIATAGMTGALVTHADGSRSYLRTLDGGTVWELIPLPLPCELPVSTSGVAGAVWLYCTSSASATVAVSTDHGSSWRQQSLPAPASPLSTMTGIDAGRALLTDGSTVSIVTMGVGAEQVSGPYRRTDNVWDDVGYTYAGFTDPRTGYLVTSGGELALSDDGGQGWAAVDLP